MTPSPRPSPTTWIAPGASIALIALATLTPGAAGGDGGGFACLFCGGRSLADFLVNVLLFVPLGATLAARGASAAVALAVGAAVTLGVELAQVAVVPGRDAALRDLVANTAGSGAGWLLLRTLWTAPPSVRRRRGLALAWAGVAAVILAGSPLLYEPAPTHRPLYLQWTARFGNMEAYGGHVLTSRIGDLDLPGPPGRIAASDRLRGLLERRAPVAVSFVAGPRPPGLAPVFSLYDDAQVEVLLVGVDGDDVVLRYRTLSRAWRLDAAPARFAGAMARAAPGDTVTLHLRAGDGAGAWCLEGASAASCRRVATPGRSWRLLHSAPAPLDRHPRAIDALWLFALLVPAGLLAPGWRERGVAAAVVAAGLAAGTVVPGLAPTPVADLVAAAAGVLAGGVLARRRPAPRPRSLDEEIDTPRRRPFLSRP